MTLLLRKTLGLVISALLLGGMVCGCDTTPTTTVEFSATLARPTTTLPIEATYDALTSASATALVVTPAIPPTATLEQPPATLRQPTAALAHPSATLAPTTPVPTFAATSIQAAMWGQRTKTSGCVIQGALPDPACTPGDIFAAATKDQICTSGYSSSVRNVSESEKDEVYAEYGIASHTAGEYEVDHLISLELGGSNDISNLWPEAASPAPGFHQKDGVENHLHSQVCGGQMALADAQKLIATNWLAAYTGTPLPTTAPTLPSPTGAPTQQLQTTATATPTGFTVIMLTSPVGVNANATLKIQTVAGASCSLTYNAPSGAKSGAVGLGATTADGNGVCAWSWRIGPSTKPGTGTLTVTANRVIHSFPIVIQ